MASPFAFEVTMETFAAEVVERSQQVPILLDFWAEWCGPCRTLGPVLESVAEEYGGAFELGKVDTEREPELAGAFQVRGIPFVVVMIGGRPVDAFTGALPAKEVRAFLARAGIQPKGVEEAAQREVEGKAAILDAAKRAILAGDLAGARRQLSEIEAESEFAAERDRLQEGLALFEAKFDEGAPAAAPLLRARQAVKGGHVERAMDEILASIEADRNFAEGLGRKAMLLCFALLGESAEACGPFRRRLATLLY